MISRGSGVSDDERSVSEWASGGGSSDPAIPTDGFFTDDFSTAVLLTAGRGGSTGRGAMDTAAGFAGRTFGVTFSILGTFSRVRGDVVVVPFGFVGSAPV
ncbi:MAG: hypothetical protein ACR2PH_07675, partial [Desulfobulbia bacterium]